MLNFKRLRDIQTSQEWTETTLYGKPLMTTPQLNKGTAFSMEERLHFGLLGKLPSRIETLEEQTKRAYQQFHSYKGNLNKNIYLNNLHDINQVLFYNLVSQYLTEILPKIYTPIVGTAVKSFSREYRRSRGIYISYPEREHIDAILENRSNPEIDVIVVTDGEGVLGIGDQGVGGMDIPIAKLMVYTLCGGINPNRTLPIQLDVGTNNSDLLDDPLYLGWREKRLQDKTYDDFIEHFVLAIKRKFPNVFLHWEDFGRDNARKILEKYQDKICTFNDDIQGTGAVTLSAILAGVKYKKETLTEQRFVIYGAGTAGTGIADQIRDALVRQGLSIDEAYEHIYLLDRPGLLLDDMTELTSGQQAYAKPHALVEHWQTSEINFIGLLDVVQHIQPTVLIGCSAQAGAFAQPIVHELAEQVEHPIILPLSNPTEKAEATPEDLLNWTHGRALIATGSPFVPVSFNGHDRPIPQCNNALVFPGIGLGVIIAKAKRCTDTMIWAACDALSEYSPINQGESMALLPDLEQARIISHKIACAVIRQAMQESLTDLNEDTDVETLVANHMWKAEYIPLKRIVD